MGHSIFTKISQRIVNAVRHGQHGHYATAERIVEMLEDDTMQRFLDIYGGKDCWLRLYKGLHDITQKYFWKETMDKCLDFMELIKEEDDIPMQYADDFQVIEKSPYKDTSSEEQQQLNRKRMQRKKYYKQLQAKYQRKNVAAYQQQVYKNN